MTIIDYYIPMFMEPWYRLTLWMKFVTMFAVLFISWIIQRVVQDFLVAKIYGYFISSTMRPSPLGHRDV